MRDRTAGAAALVYAVLAALYTWPLPARLWTDVPSDAGDPVFLAAALWWNATTVPFSPAWWTAPHFFPAIGTAAFTDSLAGLWPVYTPLYWLLGPIAAFNVAYILSWPLTALATFILVRALTGRADAAFAAGIFFAFTPYRATEIAHIQSLSVYFVPAGLFLLHRYLASSRRADLWSFGLCWILLALANGYYMCFGAFLYAAWLLYFGSPRERRAAAGRLLAAWAAASVPVLLVYARYSAVHAMFGFVRHVEEIEAFSAVPRSWFEASGDLWFWRRFLAAGKDNLFAGIVVPLTAVAGLLFVLRRARDGAAPVREVSARPATIARLLLWGTVALSAAAVVSTLAFGPWSATLAGVSIRVRDLNRSLPLLALATTVLVAATPSARAALRRRSPLVFYAAMTVVIAVLCFGPVIRVEGATVLAAAPYRLLMWLPGFSGLRVVPRFWMLGILCLSVAAGVALARTLPRRQRTAWTVVAILSAAALAESWMPRFRTALPPPLWSDTEPRERAVPILELPLGPDRDWAATFRAVSHRRRVVNGVSGYDPPHYIALRTALEQHDPTALTALASFSPLDVVVDRTADPSGEIERFVAAAPGAALALEAGERVVYRIASPHEEPRVGAAWPIAGVRAYRHDELLEPNDKNAPELADGDLKTSWADYPQTPGQWIRVDLGEPRAIGGVRIALGDASYEFPRGLAVDVSVDGQRWTRLWTGGPGAFVRALAAAPRVADAQIVFPPGMGRYVNIIQTGEAQAEWRVAEVGVLGPAASNVGDAAR